MKLPLKEACDWVAQCEICGVVTNSHAKCSGAEAEAKALGWGLLVLRNYQAFEVCPVCRAVIGARLQQTGASAAWARIVGIGEFP